MLKTILGLFTKVKASSNFSSGAGSASLHSEDVAEDLGLSNYHVFMETLETGVPMTEIFLAESEQQARETASAEYPGCRITAVYRC